MKHLSLLFLGLLLFSMAIAQATVSISGQVRLAGQLEAPSNLVIGDVGTLQLETFGEHTTQPVATAPWVTVWTDGSIPVLKTQTITGLGAGNRWARTQYPWGLVPHVGTCTYAQGTSACTVSTFVRLFDLPTVQWGCNNESCRYQVTITSGQVTKVAFKWIGEYQGFGATTVGGRNGTVCTVSNLNDTGAGSLRHCISNGAGPSSQGTYQDNVYVVFTVAGTLVLHGTATTIGYGPIVIKGRNITIDGFTAPAPGITLSRYGFIIKSGVTNTPPVQRDVHDIIVRNIAVRTMRTDIENCTTGPCLTGWSTGVLTGESNERFSGIVGPYNIVLDHNSMSESIREPWSTAFQVNDITVSYNGMAHQLGFRQGTLHSGGGTKTTLHHNVMSNTGNRNPQVAYSTTGEIDPSTSLDHRYNLYGVTMNPNTSSWGINMTHGTKANIVGNYIIGLPTVGATINPTDGICTLSDAPGTSCGSGPLDTWASGLKNVWSYCYDTGVNNSSNNWQGSCGKHEPLCDLSGDFPAGGVFSTGNVITSAFNAMPPCEINQNTPNVSAAYTAPAVTGSTAFVEACKTKAISGRWPRDSYDTAEYGLINLVGCPAFTLGSGI